MERSYEKKIAKNLGLLYRLKQLLNEEYLNIIYFSYIHSYLNYAVTWASTYYTKLHAVRIIFNEHISSHSRPLLRSLNVLNVYQINLYQHLNFMYKFNNKQTPRIFHDLIEKPVHQYPTQFSKTNFSLKKFSLSATKYLISYRGPKIWNDLPLPCSFLFILHASPPPSTYVRFSELPHLKKISATRMTLISNKKSTSEEREKN